MSLCCTMIRIIMGAWKESNKSCSLTVELSRWTTSLDTNPLNLAWAVASRCIVQGGKVDLFFCWMASVSLLGPGPCHKIARTDHNHHHGILFQKERKCNFLPLFYAKMCLYIMLSKVTQLYWETKITVAHKVANLPSRHFTPRRIAFVL